MLLSSRKNETGNSEAKATRQAWIPTQIDFRRMAPKRRKGGPGRIVQTPARSFKTPRQGLKRVEVLSDDSTPTARQPNKEWGKILAGFALCALTVQYSLSLAAATG